jgi:cation transport ATPase
LAALSAGSTSASTSSIPRRGILFKNALAIEQSASLDTVVLARLARSRP